MAKGSLSLLSRPEVAGTVFIDEQNTLGSGAKSARWPGRLGEGCWRGSDGRMCLCSNRLMGCSSGSCNCFCYKYK